MEPIHQRYKSLEWCDAEDQNPCRGVVSEEEEEEKKKKKFNWCLQRKKHSKAAERV